MDFKFKFKWPLGEITELGTNKNYKYTNMYRHKIK